MGVCMRTLVIGDIHGCHQLLTTMLEQVHYQPQEDRLILVGDYIDRGQHSKEALDLVIALVSKGAIALLGNHEEMLLTTYNHTIDPTPWMMNGGYATLQSFGVYDLNRNDMRRALNSYVGFLDSLPLYYEDEDYIFVHAGLNPQSQNPHYTNKYELLWIREEWLNCNYHGSKKVIFGHTPTFAIKGYNKVQPWLDGNKICIDTGAVYSKYGGKLTCLELPSLKFYYTHQ
jgi:serine/threonine protein phosphatase 1